MKIEFDFYGEEQVKREILRPSEKAQDLRPVWPVVVRRLQAIERAQFGTEGKQSGNPWAPLAASTLASTRDPRILRDTGALFRSLTRRYDSNSIRVSRTHLLVFGTTIPYAKYHQKGTSKMPMRKVIDLTESQKRDIVRDIQRYLFT